MIKSFNDKDTEQLYTTGTSKEFPVGICKVAIRKIDYLNVVVRLDDLRVAQGNRIEALKGKYKGKYSIRVNDQYRIVFKWQDKDVYEVELIDYH